MYWIPTPHVVLPLRALRLCGSAALALAVAACATPKPDAVAVVELRPTQGNTVMGQVRFEQYGDHLRAQGHIQGLKPNTEHGFHVHEKGDCSAPDGSSAGGHLNPDGAMHGQYGHGPHHLGDLPSLTADAAGVAEFQLDSPSVKLSQWLGKAVIVHRDPDDFKSQPAGNSGPRVACGVIRGA